MYFDTGLHETPEAACQATVGKQTGNGKIESAYMKGTYCTVSGGTLSNSPLAEPQKKQVECKNECPKDRRKDFIAFTDEDGTLPGVVCSASCEYNVDPEVQLGMKTANGNWEWAFDGISNGKSCQQETDLGKDTPQAKCVNEKGSDEYCKKPESGCPSGYKESTFNSEAYCFKKDPDEPPASNPDPNDPPSSNPDPNQPPASGPGGQGNNSCNGSNNCNTSNFDDKNIVKAINELKNAVNGIGDQITNSVSEMSSKLKNSIDKATDAINQKGQGIIDLLKGFKDWLNEDLPQKENNSVEFKDIELPQEKNDTIRFNAVCPSPVQQNVSIIGYSWTFSFSFDSYCDVLSRLANWFVFSAYLAAAFIIAGVRDA